MKTPVRFRKISELVEGKYIRFQVATCGTCGREDRWRDSTQSAAPEEMVKRQFQRRGWEFGQRHTSDLCPKCVATRDAPAPKNKEPKIMAVEAPRQPTLEDKRRIREALFSHYNEEGGCYSKSHSDKTVAAGLNVPFAWVSTAREALGFGPDTNEAASAFTGEVLSVRAELRAIQDQMLQELAARCETLEKRLIALERAGYQAKAA